MSCGVLCGVKPHHYEVATCSGVQSHKQQSYVVSVSNKQFRPIRSRCNGSRHHLRADRQGFDYTAGDEVSEGCAAPGRRAVLWGLLSFLVAEQVHAEELSSIADASTLPKGQSCFELRPPRFQEEAHPSHKEQAFHQLANGMIVPSNRTAFTTCEAGYQETSLKLVQSLTESILVDLRGAEEREVRRAADPAKDLVKSWVRKWKDNKDVREDPSHQDIRDVLQQLGEFYMRNGQRARLSPDVGQQLLDTLAAAERQLKNTE